MNLYFLVEGRSTEKKLYPKWLGHLLPSLEQVPSPSEAQANNYFLISGGGYPQILGDKLVNSLLDVAAAGAYDYFVVVLDAEEVTPAERIEEVRTKVDQSLAENGISLGTCKLMVIVQNRCIETWLLGNRRVFRRNPNSSELRRYVDFYNVHDDDPELMDKPPGTEGTMAAFHYEYLRLVLRERNTPYTKKTPGDACKSHYVDQLQQRIRDTPDHLRTLQVFFDFCREIGT